MKWSEIVLIKRNQYKTDWMGRSFNSMLCLLMILRFIVWSKWRPWQWLSVSVILSVRYHHRPLLLLLLLSSSSLLLLLSMSLPLFGRVPCRFSLQYLNILSETWPSDISSVFSMLLPLLLCCYSFFYVHLFYTYFSIPFYFLSTLGLVGCNAYVWACVSVGCCCCCCCLLAHFKLSRYYSFYFHLFTLNPFFFQWSIAMTVIWWHLSKIDTYHWPVFMYV